MSKVTFDYTKASQFINEHEVEYMKKLTWNHLIFTCRECLALMNVVDRH